MNVAIVGAGRMGRRHVEVVSRLGLDLIGVIDISKQALLDAQIECDINSNYLFNNLPTFWASHVPDCLIISTTADSHCSLVEEAARRGVKYILIEKPLAISLAECEKIISICKKNGIKVAVNHQMRFMEQYSQPKTLLNSNIFGGFRSMTVVGGNFGMAMNGTHYFEAFRFLSGSDPVEVTAWFDDEILQNPRGAQFEDRSGSIRVTNSAGQHLYIEIGAGQGHGLCVTYAGRNGIIVVNELTGELKGSVRKSEFSTFPTSRYGMPSDDFQITIEPAEVIESSSKVLGSLLSGENHVTAEQGMLAVRVLVAAHLSAGENNRAVKLSENFNKNIAFPWA